VERIVGRARADFDAGRLARCGRSVALLETLDGRAGDRTELVDQVRCARQAADALRAGDYEQSLVWVKRLRRLAPKVAWVKDASVNLVAIDGALLALKSGPLGDDSVAGLAAGVVRAADEPAGRGVDGVRPAVTVTAGVRAVGGELPRRLLVLVDGGGSYLLLTGSRVSVGRAVSDNPADVAIFSDLKERHADIARIEDDYFLFSPQPVHVAGQRTTHQLLRDKDRVVLSRRAKFTFRLPNRMSCSARIDLSDSTRMAHDVRRVVLFERIAMLGRSDSDHIACAPAGGGLLLFERGGSLWIRPRGGPSGSAQRIEPDQGVEMEGVRLVVTPWVAGTGIVNR